MKKLMIFALVTILTGGAVFAQGFDLSIGGHYEAGADVIAGNNGDDSNMGANLTQSQARLNFTVENDDGTFGGFIRLQAQMGKAPDYFDAAGYGEAYKEYERLYDIFNQGGGTISEPPVAPDPGDYVSSPKTHSPDLALAWAWWQPIQYLKLQVGILDDFYVNEIVDTFGGNAEEVGVHHAGFSDSLIIGAFGQEFSEVGAALSIYPIKGLALNVGVPYIRGNTEDETYPASNVYSYMQGQAQYTIGNIGRISLAFRGAQVTAKFANEFSLATFLHNFQITGMGQGPNMEYPEAIESAVSVSGSSGSNHAIYAAFYFTLIENMGINLGFKVSPPHTETRTREMELPISGLDQSIIIDYKATYNSPILIGLGFNCDLGAFGIAARLGVSYRESWNFETTVHELSSPLNLEEIKLYEEVKGPILTAIQILPSFDFGVCKVYLNAGLDAAVPDEGKTEVGFYVNPYVSKVIGGGSVFAGFKLWRDPGVSVNQADISAATKGDDRINWSIPMGIKIAF